MGDYGRDDRGGGRSFGGRRDFGRRSFGGDRGPRREMHSAVCSNCGKDCEVPFRPTGSKPVYCSECFEKQQGGGDSRGFQDRGSRRPDFAGRNEARPQNNDQLDAINRKLDKILGILAPAPVMEQKRVEVKPEKVEEIVIASKKKAKTAKKKALAKKE
jgi:CxxC-x17-CxxC domain-containing protein